VQAAYDAAGIGAQAPALRILHEADPSAPQAAQQAPSAPAQGVDATQDKQLEQIVELERAQEHSDLLRKNAEQE
jgi:small conductance mechanosensitive channel